mgnify:CR=1 FL=1
MGGFAHEGWRALIIVDFDVVIIDPIAGFDVPHRTYATSADRQQRRTPFPLAITFPLSGRFRDLHPLEYVRAGRTNGRAESLRPAYISCFISYDS